MAQSDRVIGDGRVEWGEKSWKLSRQASPKTPLNFLSKKDGIEGFLSWQGRLLDMIGMVGHSEDQLGPRTVATLMLQTLHRELLEELKLRLRGAWTREEMTWAGTVKLLRDLMGITQPAIITALSALKQGDNVPAPTFV